MKSYRLTETEVDRKTPSSTKIRKYVTEYIKTKELHKNLGYTINETTFEEDTSLVKNSETTEKSVKSPNSNNIVSTTTSTSSITSLAKNSEVIEKVLNHQIQIILSLQLHQLHLSHRWLRTQK